MSEGQPAGGSAIRQAILTWRQQGEDLEQHMRALGDALGRQDGARAREAFESFHALIEDHLRREEEVTFPLAEKDVPATKEPIRSLKLAHVGYRQDLGLIKTQIEHGHFEAAQALFSAFMTSFETHERLEDQLLGLLE